MTMHAAITLCLLAMPVDTAGSGKPEVVPTTMEQQLLREDPARLAVEARSQGDATRGAIAFFQPRMLCTKCHAAGAGPSPLGPDLAKPEKRPNDVHLVESLLRPSKVIRKGFESVVIVTAEGRTVTGLLAEDRLREFVLRDVAQDGKLLTIAKDKIDQRANSSESIMPTGLVNGLTTRQQFLDLVRYLMEIAEKGPTRARQLQPIPSLYTSHRIPDYENDIDHAGMIADLAAMAFRRGQAIYERLCINCHGTQERPGSLPTSLRFATGKFKNGSDPYSMYQTLTRGFGMMVPQSWMVPEQKYDVVHYIREAYLKPYNPSHYASIDPSYLARLPQGTSRGPAPVDIRPWVSMNYGPSLNASYEIGADGSNFAYKGIAIRLDPGPGGVSRGRHWMMFDHDTLRVAAAWSGKGFIDWNGIMFNGRHEVHPRIVGHVALANPTGPGWAHPSSGTFEDPRLHGRDGRPYGPLPRDWAHYRGLYHFNDQVIISYTVAETPVLEMPGVVTRAGKSVFTRSFHIGPRSTQLVLQVAHQHDATLQAIRPTETTSGPTFLFGPQVSQIVGDLSSQQGILLTGLAQHLKGTTWKVDDLGNLRLCLPPGDEPLRFTLWIARVKNAREAHSLHGTLSIRGAAMDLEPLTRGGPPRWPQRPETKPVVGSDRGPFVVDVLTHPAENPWSCRTRFSGFDFFPDGNRIALCAWDGDVWIVDGMDALEGGLTWQRIASGLFQPLGLKIVAGKIYVSCRDQLVILHDLNGNGETDFYENFNNDHQVTEHFHEFTMGLQTDAEGDFYYAKSARHGAEALVPHHGTLLKVSKDGSRTDIVATGFRAANGVCINPDGTFIVSDQEGHWNPKNRINWVREGGFYGNMWGYHEVTDSSDAAMEQPVCWITNRFDRSPAELLWVDGKSWGPLQGSLLNLSYGYGKVYVVPFEKVNGQMQGGMHALPIPQFPTGVMRGRFHPGDGQLYLCGMYVWSGTQQQPGGFYRLRYTGEPVWLPVGLKAKRQGIQMTFSGELDASAAENPANYIVKIWSLRRTANYGSEHFDERNLAVESCKLSADKCSVSLELPEIQPTWCMEITYSLHGAAGETVRGVIHNTIHHLR